MTKLRGIRYSLILLKIINFIAILFSSSLYLHATNYIIAKGQGYPHDGDDIKAQLFVHLAFLDISIGSYGKIPHLAPGNSLFGLLVFLAGAGLHLYHYQSGAIGRIGKDIQVAAA